MNNSVISDTNFADIMRVSKRTLDKWKQSGKYKFNIGRNGTSFLFLEDLKTVPEIKEMIASEWEAEMQTVPLRPYTSIELFAGAGGLALGMSKAGFCHLMLNEIDATACETLKINRPNWHIAQGDIHNLEFSVYKGETDLLTGGFPCQAFSYAGNKGGFEDTRGTLFFELARAVRDIMPKVFMCENVKGLVSHDGGRTFNVIRNTISQLGYTLVEPRVLQAIKYKVPQKRERLIMVAIRNDVADKVVFRWPSPYNRIMNLRDALYAGELYDSDVPQSAGQVYPDKKRMIMELVPMGGYWKDLPLEIQKEYMGGSYYLEGGKTGMARRLSLDEPSLTLTCSPAQKQTERCHPLETRPLTIREYARIQTFPDDWTFAGNVSSQYKQIGNAVPVNLAWAVGRSLVRLLNDIEML
ncbi:DNA cytosine methyltransferase [Prevotella sp. OH937_COT-195]|uniref:DNA cytosine methyltransferase n=1 Tax=Prevotella sp. OH937_COT-195 TaxID=2491051 RepID=UPI000F654998|nr:DNA (cytosine-5-)-methyltransferase [Prevotella sp. OH937_COT-195]RRC99456.1 DNA (cytosine-5-)-methyltransferase [Prevotella sp. OH937_COT-195]